MHCTTLQHTATHCNTGQPESAVVYEIFRSCQFGNTLQRTATHCNTLQRTASQVNQKVQCCARYSDLVLQHSATLCNTLHHTATHCNTLHHTAPHCNTPHHPATHCTTLHHTAPHHNAHSPQSLLYCPSQCVAAWCSVLQCESAVLSFFLLHGHPVVS